MRVINLKSLKVFAFEILIQGHP